jgi:hypothetical protein
MNENHLETYYVLDLDRTLLDTIKATKYMEGVIALHDANLSAVLTQQFESSSFLGESFSMRDFIVEQVGEEEMQKIEIKFKAITASEDLLMPGAKDLIDFIATVPSTACGIMTYGSISGQTMKIEASGLGDMPFLITQETFKGAVIASWRQDDELYHVPDELGGYIAKEIVFVDDKPFSFKGLPIDCRGYLVKSIFDAGIEDIPLSVKVIETLSEVIAAEKQRQ